jgi:hypothetical protein
LAIAFTGIAVCVSSAIVPSGGVALGVRVVVVFLASLVFIGELVTLVKPDTRRKLDDRLRQTRFGAILFKLMPPDRSAD